jgi:hypothetical protein
MKIGSPRIGLSRLEWLSYVKLAVEIVVLITLLIGIHQLKREIQTNREFACTHIDPANAHQIATCKKLGFVP